MTNEKELKTIIDILNNIALQLLYIELGINTFMTKKELEEHIKLKLEINQKVEQFSNK